MKLKRWAIMTSARRQWRQIYIWIEGKNKYTYPDWRCLCMSTLITRELLLWLLLKTHLNNMNKSKAKQRKETQRERESSKRTSMVWCICRWCSRFDWNVWTRRITQFEHWLNEQKKDLQSITSEKKRREEEEEEEVKTNDQLRHPIQIEKKKDEIRWNLHVILRIFDRPSLLNRMNETLPMR